MRKVRADVVVLGTGCAAVLCAIRARALGFSVALVNPNDGFSISDILPSTGLGLWNAAYRAENKISLSELYDTLVERLRELFPASIGEIRLRRDEQWSILSNTPVYRAATEELEREFFKLERKNWSSGHFRLVNPDHVVARLKRLNLDLNEVANVDGGIMRSSCLWWDAPMTGLRLMQFARDRIENVLVDVKIEARHGRRLVLSGKAGEEISVEAQRRLIVCLDGELLPSIKKMVAALDDSWIGGVRKRRKEQHFAEFKGAASDAGANNLWLELGSTRYYMNTEGRAVKTNATWMAQKGPDGLEKVVDEGLRMQRRARFVGAERAFRLEWDWRGPQWRMSEHDTVWGTSFEGDIWSTTELAWNLPVS